MTQSKPLPLNGAGVRFFSSCSRRFRRALLCFCSRRCRRRPSCISWCSTCFVAGVQQVVSLLFSRPAHRSWYLCSVLPQGAHLSRGTAQGSRTRTLPRPQKCRACIPHSPPAARLPIAYAHGGQAAPRAAYLSLCTAYASSLTRPLHGSCTMLAHLFLDSCSHLNLSHYSLSFHSLNTPCYV